MRCRASNGCDARCSLKPEYGSLTPECGSLTPRHGDQLFHTIVDTLRRAGCVFAEEEAAILLESVGNGAGSGEGTGSNEGAETRPGSSRAHGHFPDADPVVVLENRVARRVAGEPLEQIVGWVDFAGLRLRTLPGAFVPRQRTRMLAERTLRACEQGARLRSAETGAPVVVEAFCGVGPVGSYVAASRAEVCLHLGDMDAQAAACAVDNARTAARRVGSAAVIVRGHRLDCLVGLPDELRHSVDVIAAVPPYVPTTAADFLPREAVDFEPAAALFGGVDGLDLVRRLVSEADDWLSAEGMLLIELGREQADDALTYATAHGLVGSGRLGEGAGDYDPDEHTVVLELRRIR